VNSDPAGAVVSVNGERKGSTPLKLDIECGLEYTLVLSAAGRRSETRSLNWEYALENERLAVTLPAVAPGVVAFQGPYIVTVMKGSRIIARGSRQVELPPGNHKLTLINRRHFLLREYTVQVREGQRQVIALPKLGLLSVFPRPANCAIEIDGIRLTREEVPLRRRAVISGKHDIKFSWGSISRTGTIEVPAGGAISVLGTEAEITVRSPRQN